MFSLYAVQTASYSFFSAVDVAVVVIIGQDANCINSICIQNCSSVCVRVCVRIQVYNLYKLHFYCFKNLWFYVIVYVRVIVRTYAYVCTHINVALQHPTKMYCVCLLLNEWIFKWIFKSCPKLKFKFILRLCTLFTFRTHTTHKIATVIYLFKQIIKVLAQINGFLIETWTFGLNPILKWCENPLFCDEFAHKH